MQHFYFVSFFLDYTFVEGLIVYGWNECERFDLLIKKITMGHK